MAWQDVLCCWMGEKYLSDKEWQLVENYLAAWQLVASHQFHDDATTYLQLTWKWHGKATTGKMYTWKGYFRKNAYFVVPLGTVIYLICKQVCCTSLVLKGEVHEFSGVALNHVLALSHQNFENLECKPECLSAPLIPTTFNHPDSNNSQTDTPSDMNWQLDRQRKGISR